MSLLGDFHVCQRRILLGEAKTTHKRIQPPACIIACYKKGMATIVSRLNAETSKSPAVDAASVLLKRPSSVACVPMQLKSFPDSNPKRTRIVTASNYFPLSCLSF